MLLRNEFFFRYKISSTENGRKTCGKERLLNRQVVCFQYVPRSKTNKSMLKPAVSLVGLLEGTDPAEGLTTKIPKLAPLRVEIR